MIFDCHTHVFGPGHCFPEQVEAGKRVWGDKYKETTLPEEHWEHVKDIDGAVVLAFDAAATGTVVPNEYVAEYVSRHPGKLYGFASVDPNRENAARLLEEAIKGLNLCGLKLAPIYQNFYPEERRHFELYAKANELKVPILFHQGTSYVSEGYLDASRSASLDPIAREFPDLTIVIAHMGHPWIDECIAVVRKHKNMYMDLSALCGRPWQFYNALVSAMEYGVPHKILLGSDYPFFTITETIEALRNVNHLVEGTKLPRIPDEMIEGIIHRHTPELLGLVK